MGASLSIGKLESINSQKGGGGKRGGFTNWIFLGFKELG
jgi:hypothetical protein